MVLQRHLRGVLLIGGALLFASIAHADQTKEPAGVVTERYGVRSMIVVVPPTLPAPGTRALVVVLHGGLGDAQRIEGPPSEHGQSEGGLKLDQAARANGFIVAYLNGTRATRLLGSDKLAWNAGGGCCGQPAETKVDDVGYIRGAVDYLAGKYGIDRARVFGIGHSNGAMMTQRVMCETGLYAAAVAISGPLNLDTPLCIAAQGKHMMAIHGADDRNVPIVGGRGSKGISGVSFKSEESSRQVFMASGASYDLQVINGADHKLDDIDAVLHRTEGRSIAEKAAEFFGLVNPHR